MADWVWGEWSRYLRLDLCCLELSSKMEECYAVGCHGQLSLVAVISNMLMSYRYILVHSRVRLCAVIEVGRGGLRDSACKGSIHPLTTGETGTARPECL